MMSEASLLIEKHHVVTIPKDIREVLSKRGWKDGKVFLIFDESTDSLRVVTSEKIKKVIADARI